MAQPIPEASAVTPRTGRRAFTLLELLVVLTVIAVLVALMLPALDRARRISRDILCRSRMRSVYMLSEIYRSDFKEWYPMNCMLDTYSPYMSGGDYWYSLLITPYLPTSLNAMKSTSTPEKNPLMCPANGYRPNFTLTQARAVLYDGPGGIYLNYWSSARYGFNPSSVQYMPRKTPTTRPERSILIGEVFGVTATRFGHSSGNIVYFHTNTATNMVTAGGRIVATSGVSASELDVDNLQY